MQLRESKNKTLRRKLENLLTPEAVEEAFTVLTMCDEKWYNSFNEQWNQRKWNTACISIDFAKDQLVKDGKIEAKEGDHFGGIQKLIEE